MLRVFLLSIFSLCTLLASGQATRIYDHRDYGFGELSSNLIKSISQDKHGYIWIATEYGLNKFDGIRFIQYLHDIQDSTSISSNHVTILHRDCRDHLWIGCSNGLQYYDENKDQFIRIQFPDEIAPHITDILTRHDESLLVTTSGWGLFFIDIANRVAIRLEGANERIGGMYGRRLAEDQDQPVCSATDRRGVGRLSPDFKHVQKLAGDRVPFPNGDKYNMLVTDAGDVILSYHAQIVLADRSARHFQ